MDCKSNKYRCAADDVDTGDDVTSPRQQQCVLCGRAACGTHTQNTHTNNHDCKHDLIPLAGKIKASYPGHSIR